MGIKGLFKRKSDEVVDLADLQKRGIYKPKLPKKDEKGVVDFSMTAKRIETEKNEEVSALGFLGSFSDSSSNTIEQSGAIAIDNRKKRIGQAISDLRSNMKQNNDKVYKLIERIDLLEKKLDRIERRVGL